MQYQAGMGRKKAHLGSEEMQVPFSLLQELWVSVPVDNGQHLAVSALGKEADTAIWGAGNDAHAAPLTAELHDVQHVIGGLVAQHPQGHARHVTAHKLKAQLAATFNKSHLIWRGTLQQHRCWMNSGGAVEGVLEARSRDQCKMPDSVSVQLQCCWPGWHHTLT